MKNILFIVGSLRKGSFNHQLAEEAEKMLAGKANVSYLDYSQAVSYTHLMTLLKLCHRQFMRP